MTHYRIRNWKDYNTALVNRGNITIWFSEDAIKGWNNTEESGKKGRPKIYSDTAIVCALTIRAVFHLPLRATEGFLCSLIKMLQLPLAAPDYSTLCIRQKTVKTPLLNTKPKEGVHILVDSSGLKVFGEGEWKTRQHGYSKRRTWRKIHLVLDADSQEIIVAGLTTSDCHDGEILPDLLESVNVHIDSVTGDGAYDTENNYNVIHSCGAKPIIPPRRNARAAQYSDESSFHLPRDKVIETMRSTGVKFWKQSSGYHKRSLVETAMFRFKTIFGDRLAARDCDNQAAEVFIKCSIMNKMTQIGMPVSYIAT